MTKINREVAEGEVTLWLDKKKVFQATRESQKEFIDILVEAIVEGVLVLDQSTFKFTHTLLFPIGESEMIKSLVYVSRLNDKMLRPCLNGVKQGDGDERMLAYIAALTDQPRGLMANLDSADKKVATAIAVFFL